MDRVKIDEHYVKIIDSLIRDNIVKNDAEFAAIIGVPANVISNIRNKNKHVAISQIYNTCIKFNISADNILFVDGELDEYKKAGKKPYKIKYTEDNNATEVESEYLTKKKERLSQLEPLIRQGIGLIPMYQLSASDSLQDFFKDPYLFIPEDYFFIPNAPSCDGILRVYDDRMSPIISKSDFVAFKRINDLSTHLFSGDTYLILQGNETEELLTISNIQSTDNPDQVKFIALNKNYTDRIVPKSNIKAVAKIKISTSIKSMS